MKAANIARRLKQHDRWCKVHTHEQYCSCGRDDALAELTALLENQLPEPTHELTTAQLKRRLQKQEPKGDHFRHDRA